MELLDRLVTVDLERITDPQPAPAVTSSSRLALHPRQPLRFRLSVRFDADSEVKKKTAVTFLSQIGEARLEEAWALLFDRLVLSPFLLSGSAAAIVSDDEDDADGDEDATSSVSSAPTGEWRDEDTGPVGHRPTLPSLSLGGITDGPSAAAAAPQLPPPPATAAATAPTSPAGEAEEVTVPSRGGGRCCGGGVFAFGAQGFWLERAYQGGNGDASARVSEQGQAPSPPPPPVFVPQQPQGSSVASSGRPLPGLSRAVSGTPAAAAPGVMSDFGSCAMTPEECLVAGPAITAECTELTVTPAETREAAALAHRLSIPSAMVIPHAICSQYVFDYMVPDEALWVAEAPLPRVLAFVLLLPLHRSGAQAECNSGFGESAPSSDLQHEDDYFVMRRVLSRNFVDPLSSWFPANYLFAAAPLGCCYVPVSLQRALACESVAYPLSNDQLLLSLSVTNVTALPVRLQSISLDLYSTHESHALPSPLCWGATRPAAHGNDRRLIDLLTKLVTVTPMIVSHDRPPFTLQAEETYSFQCILQVVPEFNYVLNPSSLEHVYQRLCQEREATAAAAAAADGSGVPRVVMPGQTTSATSTALRDDDGTLVTTEDVVKVMSGVYQSYLFVYYRVDEDATGVDAEATTSVVSGLHLRHPVQWSFGI